MLKSLILKSLVVWLSLPILSFGMTFVRESTGSQNISSTNTVTYTVTAPASGDIVMLVLGRHRIGGNSGLLANSATLTNVTFTELNQDTTGNSAFGIDIFYGVVSGTGGTSLVITFNQTPTSILSALSFSEYSGVGINPNSFLDGAVGNDDSGNLGQSTLITSNGNQQCTTQVLNDLFVAATIIASSVATFSTQPSGYTPLTLVTGTSSFKLQVDYLLVGTIGNQSPQWTVSTNVDWSAMMIALKPVYVANSSVTN